MNAVRVRALVVVLLALAAVAGAHAWRPTAYLADVEGKLDLEAVFAPAFGDWRIDDRMPVQLVSPDQQAMLSRIYSQTLNRTYVNSDGDRIMLSVAYGGDQSDATRAHRPEVCYPAQGFQVLSQATGQAELGNLPLPVRRLVAQQGARIEPITYWLVVGDRVAVSSTQQKLQQLYYSTRGVIPDGMLVRVSSIDRDSAHAFGVQQKFIADLARAMKPAYLSRVFGGAASPVGQGTRVGSTASETPRAGA